MSKSEFLVFLPLFFYGFALAELLREWKRLFRFEDMYLPYSIITIVLTEGAIYNVYILSKLLSELEHVVYITYLSYLISPFLFMLLVNIYTPEQGDNTKEYFEKNRLMYFSLSAVFVASHFLFDYDETIYTTIGRLIFICSLLFAGIVKKSWTIYFVFILWIILSSSRIYMKAF